ncbi:LamG domain-containing protein [Stieleria tagensis]|uniref:LamG domain-containing protein n=1 Tax=Stieleria tagensis TaxID=2956795 RepID=UPI00209A68FA|nr:LamG domain-containing protein [Stieleria tagensis]
MGLFNFDGNNTNTVAGGSNGFGSTAGYSGGFEGQATNFAGPFDFMYIPIDLGTSNTPSVTFGGWTRASNATGNQDIFAIDDFDSTTPERSIGIRNSDGNGWQYSATTGTGNQSFGVGGPVEDDWSFVAARYDGSNVTLFVDGSSFSMFDNTAINPNRPVMLRVGGSPLSNDQFVGSVDNLFVFDEALSDQQIEHIWLGGSTAIMAPSAIPEPSCLALGLLTVAGLGLRRKRRKALCV